MKFNDENRMEVIGLQCMMFLFGLTVLIGMQLINLITCREQPIYEPCHEAQRIHFYTVTYIFAAAFKNFP